ncbi:MAG: 50S ribosomal protein L24e [Candidatus Aenigmarchaeota archaeon]|nr:50S ribosomal protein L24e [Candidatus Aenigmarchaeota archaeon]
MKCSFCSSNIPRGKGKMFIKNSGEISYFDKSKCEKNFFMGRNRKKLKWAKSEKKVKKK